MRAFGATIPNIVESLDKMASGMLPVTDTGVPVDNVAIAPKHMESRQMFGKLVVGF
jgi:alcohol dehydrogenase